MLKKIYVIALAFSICLACYCISYFLIKQIKPKCLIVNDTVSPIYKCIYWPIRRVDVKYYSKIDKIDEAVVIFDGCNGLGDKIFLKHNGDIISILTDSEEVSEVALSLSIGDKVYVHIKTLLLTDSSYENSLYPLIDKIKRCPVQKKI